MQVHKQQINLLEENEKELAKKNVSNLKVLRMLTDKCHSQEAMIVELEEKFNELSELNAFKDEDLRAMKSELYIFYFIVDLLFKVANFYLFLLTESNFHKLKPIVKRLPNGSKYLKKSSMRIEELGLRLKIYSKKRSMLSLYRYR
jgi:hypothetical protein